MKTHVIVKTGTAKQIERALDIIHTRIKNLDKLARCCEQSSNPADREYAEPIRKAIIRYIWVVNEVRGQLTDAAAVIEREAYFDDLMRSCLLRELRREDLDPEDVMRWAGYTIG